MSPSSRDVGANVSRTKIASDFASDRKLGSGYQKSAPTTVSFNADAIDDDSALLALGKQFEEIADEIRNLRNSASSDARLEQIEAALGRLEPVEAAIMAAPAHTFAGLGVKARHAAYVMSEYWNGPIDRIDWDARAVRLLIEAVCKSAGTPLPFHGAPNPE
jgi:hypothetical protein